MTEKIQRKFLVHLDLLDLIACLKAERIVQAYLSLEADAICRIRVQGKRLFKTVEDYSEKSLLDQGENEEEYLIDLAPAMFKDALPGRISKKRHFIPLGKSNWLLDIFSSKNKDLVLVNLNLPSEVEDFFKPEWLGKEVTGVKRFYDHSLLIYPYSEWTDEEKAGK